jgi:hypothetical protein
MYCWPNKTDFIKNSFFHYFQEITENDCIFLGDFNINTNKMSENKSWINCYETEGYKQLIENFTRVSDNSSSIIDHIYEKEMSKWNKFCKRMNGFRKGCLKLLCCCPQKKIHKSISHSSINQQLDQSIRSESIESEKINSSENIFFEKKLNINDRIEVQIDNCSEDKQLLDSFRNEIFSKYSRDY